MGSGSRAEATLDADFFSAEALADPYPLYAEVRHRGPLVYLSNHDVVAVGGYNEAREILRSPETFTSQHGIGLNPVVNRDSGRPITLTSEGETHRLLKSIVMAPMMPKAMDSLASRLEVITNQVVDDLAGRKHFEGVSELAVHLPVTVVSHLVGLPEEGRQNMLKWSAATFNLIGPLNERAKSSIDSLLEMSMYAASLTRDQLAPGSWGSLIFAAVDEGRLPEDLASGLFIDYIAPSLDTTIHAVSHMINLFGAHPDQWETIRRDESLLDNAVEEVLRFEAPVRGFTRVAACSTSIGGVPVNEGDRIWVLNGSANRDEARFERADEFDITRSAAGHLSFGYGPHLCAGVHLARLEMRILLRVMRERFRTIEIGEKSISENNILRGWASLDVTVT
jgi:cytochrome P450